MAKKQSAANRAYERALARFEALCSRVDILRELREACAAAAKIDYGRQLRERGFAEVPTMPRRAAAKSKEK